MTLDVSCDLIFKNCQIQYLFLIITTNAQDIEHH
jgi:hypothetical protein